MADPSDGEGDVVAERALLFCRVIAGEGLGSVQPAIERSRALTTRMQVAGGEVVLRVGSSVAVTFDPMDLLDVVDLALGALSEKRSEQSPVSLVCCITLGEVVVEGGVALGAAVDRALAIAGRARPFELVVDDPARSHLDAVVLFARTLDADALVSHTVDPRYPHRAQCRLSLARLLPPTLPRCLEPAVDQVRALAVRPEAAVIVVHAVQTSAALDVIERLGSELGPALQLQLSSVSRGLAPLGGLQAALRTMSAPSLLAALPAEQRDALDRCAGLAAVPREQVIGALAALLSAASALGRVWLVLPSPHEIDPPTLAVVVAAVERSSTAPLCLVLADDTGVAPSALARIAESSVITIGSLELADRLEVAASVLGAAADREVVRHVAQLGGETAHGVLEAARTLVAAGDIVFADDRHRFRTEPRAAHLPIPIEALLAERLLGLEPAAQRVLEALCIAPPGTTAHLADHIARLDGLSAGAIVRARRVLQDEGWINELGLLGSLCASIGDAVRNAMPPARASELSRFAASALQAELAPLPAACFGRGLVAYYLAQGGREADAAPHLIDAAEAAVAAGFPTTAVRLAARARTLDATGGAALRALTLSAGIAQAAARSPQAAPATGEAVSITQGAAHPTQRPARRSRLAAAIAAVLGADGDAAEREIDAALASGCEPAGATLLSAVVALRRGNFPDAVRALRRPEVQSASRARRALSAALLLFEAGATFDAVRGTLEALSAARATRDLRGERAALEVLAACYQTLGRAPETTALRLAIDRLY